MIIYNGHDPMDKVAVIGLTRTMMNMLMQSKKTASICRSLFQVITDDEQHLTVTT
jgi:hypothetical protein